MRVGVSFFHLSSHEQGEWILDKKYHAEICKRRSQDLGQFIDGLAYRLVMQRFWVEYPTSHLYFLQRFGIKIKSDKCTIPCYTMKNLYITILFFAVENILQDGKAGFNTIKYKMLACVLIGCIFRNCIDKSKNKRKKPVFISDFLLLTQVLLWSI